jgi:hypothetical protein
MPREDQVAVGLGGVGDPDLGAGQAVGIRCARRAADGRGRRPQRGGIGPGVGLGQGEGTQRLAGQHGCQPARLLLGRAPGDDRELRQDVDRQGDGHGHVSRAQLLHDQGPAEVRHAGAADHLGEWRAGQAQGAHGREQRAVVALVRIARDGPRRDLALGELAGRGLEQPFLFRQGAVHDG